MTGPIPVPIRIRVNGYFIASTAEAIVIQVRKLVMGGSEAEASVLSRAF